MIQGQSSVKLRTQQGRYNKRIKEELIQGLIEGSVNLLVSSFAVIYFTQQNRINVV